MRFVSFPPAVLFGFEAEFRLEFDTARRRNLRDTWQLWLNGQRMAGPAEIQDALRLEFPTAGSFELEARTVSGAVIDSLRYRVYATLADELEAVAHRDTPATQLAWVQKIRARGVPPVAQLEQAIKDQFLVGPVSDDRWARGLRLLVCLYLSELSRCRPFRTLAEDWEDALECVVVTFLEDRAYDPKLDFVPYCWRVLHNQCVNGHRKSGYPDPGRNGKRKPFLPLEPDLYADPTPDLDDDPDPDDDDRPMEIRVPAKMRKRIRLRAPELAYAAGRNVEFSWEPRRRKPWTPRDRNERALREGTTWPTALSHQKKLIRAWEASVRARDNLLPDPQRDREDAEWEKKQRRHGDDARRRGRVAREKLTLLNAEALRQVIPWYNGPGDSRATTLFEMRSWADRVMAFFAGPAARARGPALQELAGRMESALQELTEGYGREGRPHALDRFGQLVETAEEVVDQCDLAESEEIGQALADFLRHVALICDKLQALHRLYPCRRLLRDLLNDPEGTLPAVAALAAWLDEGAWRSQLGPADRDTLRSSAAHLLAARDLWPKSAVAPLRLVVGWLHAVADDDEAALAWLFDLDACWRWSGPVVEDLPEAADPAALLVGAAWDWHEGPTPERLKAVLEKTAALDDLCRARAEAVRARGRTAGRWAERLGRRLAHFRRRVAERRG